MCFLRVVLLALNYTLPRGRSTIAVSAYCHLRSQVWRTLDCHLSVVPSGPSSAATSKATVLPSGEWSTEPFSVLGPPTIFTSRERLGIYRLCMLPFTYLSGASGGTMHSTRNVSTQPTSSTSLYGRSGPQDNHQQVTPVALRLREDGQLAPRHCCPRNRNRGSAINPRC